MVDADGQLTRWTRPNGVSMDCGGEPSGLRPGRRRDGQSARKCSSFLGAEMKAKADVVKEALLIELERSRVQLMAEWSSNGMLGLIDERLKVRSEDMYVLHWIPEQGEDIYDILVDGKSVLRVEISRSPGVDPLLCAISLEQYRATFCRNKTCRRRLAGAMELSARRPRR